MPADGLAALLAARQALDVAIQASQSGAAVDGDHDNGIASDGGALENPMCRIQGPYKDRKGYRIKVVDVDTGKTINHCYATEDEALAAIPQLKRQHTRPVGVSFADAIATYGRFLEQKGNRPRSIEVTLERLRTLFADVRGLTGDVTPEKARKVWDAWTTRVGRRSGKLPSVNTCVGVLAEARTFTKWLTSKEWAKAGLLDGVEVLGRRKRGKAQFVGLDEARRFGAKALELAKAGDVGATAALTALVLGVRASEITDRTVRELDDAGRYLVITSAKTEAGIRRLRVPEVLQPLLVGLAAGKGPTDRLFGDGVGRHWVLRSVRRVCGAAGVSVISSHGLRASHASMAVDAGMSGPLVAKALGHEDFGITSRHYASPDSVEGARIDRMLRNFSDDFPNRSADSAKVPQPASC